MSLRERAGMKALTELYIQGYEIKAEDGEALLLRGDGRFVRADGSVPPRGTLTAHRPPVLLAGGSAEYDAQRMPDPYGI